MLLDTVPDVPCMDDGWICALRAALEYVDPASLVFGACIGLGFVLAVSFSVVSARMEKTGRRPARRRPAAVPRRRVVSGPVHTDGRWVRIVEDERGERCVEVLDGVEWRPTTTPDLRPPLALHLPTHRS